MPRKPITTYAGGKGPRQMIWEAIRTNGPVPEWTRDSLSRATGIENSTITSYLQALVKAGIIDKVGENNVGGAATENRYTLIKDEGLEAPRLRRDGTRVTQGLAQEQMWRTLRILTADTNARELAAHASTPTVPVSSVAANDYLQMLNTAGYLARTREGKGKGCGGTLARYRLKPARNTGPRPPMICRTKVVYDPNEDKVVYAPAVTEEDAIYA